MHKDETIKPLINGVYNNITMGRQLCAMINRGYLWVTQRRSGGDGTREFYVAREHITHADNEFQQQENLDENPF